jgi:acyl carrier protein
MQADLLALVRARGLDHAGVAADTDLIDGGLLDSLLLTDLILHIEERYAVAFDAGDVSPGNFRSVAAIVDLVLGRPPAARSA